MAQIILFSQVYRCNLFYYLLYLSSISRDRHLCSGLSWFWKGSKISGKIECFINNSVIIKEINYFNPRSQLPSQHISILYDCYQLFIQKNTQMKSDSLTKKIVFRCVYIKSTPWSIFQQLWAYRRSVTIYGSKSTVYAKSFFHTLHVSCRMLLLITALYIRP